LLIAWYERQAKISGSSSFYETLSSVAEKMIETLPRGIKRMSSFISQTFLICYLTFFALFSAFFEGLAGYDADIETVGVFHLLFIV
jgi:hypothetical protein